MVSLAKPPCDDGVMRSAANTAPCSKSTGRWVLAVTILGSSMVFIDGTVVNVALPVLQRDLHASVGDVQWIVEAYSLFLAALILVGGSLGDHFGRRRIFTTGVVIFTASSVICGLAPGVGVLIAARAVQGIGGALLTPGSLAIISATFSDQQRGRAIGTWSGFTSITSALGPVLGGSLVQYASWRWVFFINVPLAALVLAISLKRVPESRDPNATARLDYPGALLATLGLGALVFGLITAGSTRLSNPVVLLSLALGIVALVAFILVERRSLAPMMPLSLFRSRTFSGTNLLTFLLYAALGEALFFLPFNLIQVQGYGATAAGAAFLPFIVIMFTLSRWSGGLVTRFGSKLPLIVGPVIAAAGFALFAVPDIGGSYWTTYFPAVVVLGLGMAITVAPLTTTVMGSVGQERAGIASGINNAVSRTAGLIAIAVVGIVVVAVFGAVLDSHLNVLNLAPQVRHFLDGQQTNLASMTIPSGLSASAQLAVKRAIDESFVAAFRAAMFVGVALALVSAVCAGILVEGKGVPRRRAARASSVPAAASEAAHDAGHDAG